MTHRHSSLHPHAKRWEVALLCIVSSLSIFFVDRVTPRETAEACFYVIVVFISLWEETEEFSIGVATHCSLLTILGFFVSSPTGSLEIAISNRFIALFLIWSTTVLIVQRKKLIRQRNTVLKEKEDALAQIKVLGGLLPICSSCKKIRDDKGYWTHVEAYIAEYSEAKFTHGLCEGCIQKLYPQIASKMAASGKT